jgi:hypothetical protein
LWAGKTSPINMTDAGEIERAVADFARGPNGGVIVTGSALTIIHRDHIIALAARYKLPAIYYEDNYVAADLVRGRTTSTNSVALLAMSIASSRARSRPTCRCRRRPNMSW